METCGTPRVLVPTCGGVQKKNLLLEGKVLLKKYWKILRHLLCSCASHHTRYTTEEMLLGALLIISWEHDMIHIQ